MSKDGTKKCTRCKVVKPYDDFYGDKRRSTGLQAQCKECMREARREERKSWTTDQREAATKREKDWYEANKDRVLSVQSAWYQTNRNKRLEQERARRIRILYGLTMEDFWDMYDAQEGRCMICGFPTHAFVTPLPKGFFRRTAIDHDSLTGEVRGLLCSYCNTAIGLLGHDIDRLASAITYLLEHGARQTDPSSCCTDPTHPSG